MTEGLSNSFLFLYILSYTLNYVEAISFEAGWVSR